MEVQEVHILNLIFFTSKMIFKFINFIGLGMLSGLEGYNHMGLDKILERQRQLSREYVELRRLEKQYLEKHRQVNPRDNPLELGNPLESETLFKEASKSYEEQPGFRRRTPPRSSKLIKEGFTVIENPLGGFEEVMGCDQIKRETQQWIHGIKHPDLYLKYDVQVSRGVLLVGPPGTGKTFLARAIAAECQLPFIPVTGSHFHRKWVGEGNEMMTALKKVCREYPACIVFLDEADTVAGRREVDGQVSSHNKNAVINNLLDIMDGFDKEHRIYFILATNMPELLDPAVTRSGRIDRTYTINLPDDATREKLLEKALIKKPYNFDPQRLVTMTEGLSCADINNLINSAFLNALLEEREILHYQDIAVVYDRIVGGYQSSPVPYTLKDLNVTAVHEMGHALAGYLSPEFPNPKLISLSPDSPSNAGYTVFDRSESRLQTNISLFSMMVTSLGGRVAEELVFDSITTGAVSDLDIVRNLARDMIRVYGFGDTSTASYESEEWKHQVDCEVNTLIQRALKITRQRLEPHRSLLVKLAAALLDKNKMYFTEFESLINRNHPDWNEN